MTQPSQRRREIVSRTVTPAEAVEAIPDGSTVFVGTGAGEPLGLVDLLATRAVAKGLRLLFGFSLRRPPRLVGPVPLSAYLHVGYRQAPAMEEGHVDWIPVELAHVPGMFEHRKIPIDVALISVSPADSHGQFSLGTSVDVTRAAVEAASLVIAQINPFVPRTHGQSFLDYRKIHLFTSREEPLPEVFEKRIDTPVEEEIARHVIRLIPDGATLQLGFPRVPRQLLYRMSERRELGVHSLLVSDWVMELLENGTVTNTRKGWSPGKVTASCALGSRRFYDYLNDSPLFEFQGVDVVADPQVIARNPAFVSVLDAEAVDLQGRTSFRNSPYSRRLSAFLGASGGHPGDGLTVLVLTARNLSGAPTIRLQLPPEEVAGHGCAAADCVVTEYGVAFLRGRSLQQRALQLIPVMHPEDRGPLWAAAVARRWFCPAYARREPQGAWSSPGPAGSSRPASSSVTVRAAGIQDFEAARRFHFALPEQDLSLRFFDHHVDLDAYLLKILHQDQARLFFAVETRGDAETLLGVAEGHFDPEKKTGELALIVHPGHRRRGVGRALVAAVTAWTVGRGAHGLEAEVLNSNTPMILLLRSCGWRGTPKEGSELFSLELGAPRMPGK